MQTESNGPDTNRFGYRGAGSAPGQFNGPQGAVVDAAGNVYTGVVSGANGGTGASLVEVYELPAP